MIFTPYSDEQKIINRIHKIRNEDYALIRLTYTMIDKNIIDANGIMRSMLSNAGLSLYVNNEKLLVSAQFVQDGKSEAVELRFYEANTRKDKRFSFENIKRRKNSGELAEGDLLYFSAYKDDNNNPQVFIINLTRNTPSEQQIVSAIGLDKITSVFNTLKPKLKEIINGGYYNNSKGTGVKAPKDVGDTLEYLLGVETNNRHDADYKGLIEIKSKGEARTLDTLFTLRPRFEGTAIEAYEPSDRNRVSAFARYYGYDSDKHPGYNSLYITIGSYSAPQNTQGFFLDVDEENEKVTLNRINPTTNKVEITAYWYFNDLKEQLYAKHPSTIWVKAQERVVDDMVQFKYTEIEFSRSPQFTTFLSLIKSGAVTYDWRGYTTKEGKYSGKNHGNAWRIKPNLKSALFGDIEKVELGE